MERGTYVLQNDGERENKPYPGTMVTPNICYCTDRKYRWYYEYNLLRNPRIFITIVKVIGLSFLILYIMMIVFTLIDGGPDVGEDILSFTRVMAFVVLGAFVLTGISYVIYALALGGKYMVLFEMSEICIRHIQCEKQFEKAQAIGWLNIFMGAKQGNLAQVAGGKNVMMHSESISNFDKVTSIKARKRGHIIYVNEMLTKNQIYADEADFEFVADFIIRHCPQVKVK